MRLRTLALVPFVIVVSYIFLVILDIIDLNSTIQRRHFQDPAAPLSLERTAAASPSQTPSGHQLDHASSLRKKVDVTFVSPLSFAVNSRHSDDRHHSNRDEKEEEEQREGNQGEMTRMAGDHSSTNQELVDATQATMLHHQEDSQETLQRTGETKTVDFELDVERRLYFEAETEHKYICQEMSKNVLSLLDVEKTYVAHKLGDLFVDRVCKRQFADWSGGGGGGVKEVVMFADNEETAGLGARMMRVGCSFWAAYSQGGALSSQPFARWLYASPTCEQQSNDCYFQPLTTSDNTRLVTQTVLDAPKPAQHPEPGQLPSSIPEFLKPGEPTLRMGSQSAPKLSQWNRASLTHFYTKFNRGLEHIKQVPSSPLQNHCWLMGVMLLLAMQANEEVSQAALAAREELGFRHPIVAMHVRHGDRAARGQKGALMGLEKYMQEAKTIAPHVKRVLIMTEDQEVIDDTAKFPDYEFVFTKVPRLNTNIGLAIKEGRIDPKGEIFNAVINLYMAVDSDYFVGGLGSSWARMILTLSFGKYNCLQPHATLGSTWSNKWEFGMCTTTAFEEAKKIHMCNPSKGGTPRNATDITRMITKRMPNSASANIRKRVESKHRGK